MPTNLATYFDSKYLAKGLALIKSLARHLPDWRLYVLALDDLTFETISGLSAKPEYRGRLEVRPLRSIETPLLLRAKARATWREYIFTLTPVWTDYVLTTFSLPDVAYIDADCFLYADLEPLYAELGAASIGIIPHRWTPRHESRLRSNGIYNVGWVYFRRDNRGMACLAEWAGECLTYSGPLGKFSDQVYLDTWPQRYREACHIVEHPGANVAPWNQERYKFQAAPNSKAVYAIDESDVSWAGLSMGIVAPRAWPLLFYHFHEWRRDPGGIYRTGYPLASDIIQLVYEPYEAEVLNAI